MANQGESSRDEPARKKTKTSTMTQGKVYNDCVHGHIKLPTVCGKIINTAVFHRLRNVKQLGFAYHVYPAASHNRFEHSLGVSYLAGEMVDILNGGGKEWINVKEKMCMQIAGLCHDLGHGPFSHTWEKFVNKAQGTEEDDHTHHFRHEEMSTKLLDIIWQDSDVRTELSRLKMNGDDLLFIKELILGVVSPTTANSQKTTDNFRNGNLYYYEIINNLNGIDVDKWDYLIRDGKLLNIGMSFDHRRLMQCLRVCKIARDNATTEYHICYRDKVKDAILQMYTMRTELHRKAAQHRVVKCLDAMWIDALLAADEAGYTFHGEHLRDTHKRVEVYQKLDDNLFEEILHSTDPRFEESRKLLRRIISRELYTCISKRTLGANESDESTISEIYNKVQTQGEISDLFVTHTELKLPNLANSVYLYGKNENEGNLQNEREWRNEHTFPPESFVVNRKDVFFCVKQMTRPTADQLQVVETIMNEIERSRRLRLNVA